MTIKGLPSSLRSSYGKLPKAGLMTVRECTHLITEIVVNNRDKPDYVNFQCQKIRQQFFEQYRPK